MMDNYQHNIDVPFVDWSSIQLDRMPSQFSIQWPKMFSQPIQWWLFSPTFRAEYSYEYVRYRHRPSIHTLHPISRVHCTSCTGQRFSSAHLCNWWSSEFDCLALQIKQFLNKSCKPFENLSQRIIWCVENYHFGLLIKHPFKFSVIENIITWTDVAGIRLLLKLQLFPCSIFYILIENVCVFEWHLPNEVGCIVVRHLKTSPLDHNNRRMAQWWWLHHPHQHAYKMTQ